MECAKCGQQLDPVQHGDLVCDGKVFCCACHRYHRKLLEPLPFQELAAWNERICLAFGYEPALLVAADRPPAGPFDFLKEQKVLLAEADHGEGSIVLFPPGMRLATLCHELAHLMTGQEHTATWAEHFAELVAWVTARLPEDRFTDGFYVNLLAPRQD